MMTQHLSPNSFTPITDVHIIAPPYSGKTSRVDICDRFKKINVVRMSKIIPRHPDGKLQPDHVAIAAWVKKARISEGAFFERRVITDGMPRNATQVEKASELLFKAQLFTSSVFVIMDRSKEWCLDCFDENAKQGINRGDRSDDRRDILECRLNEYFEVLPEIITTLKMFAAKVVTMEPTDSWMKDSHDLLKMVGWVSRPYDSQAVVVPVNDFLDGFRDSVIASQ